MTPRGLIVLLTALLLAACARPPSEDIVRTPEQAIDIAERTCNLARGEEGSWHAHWSAGQWNVTFGTMHGAPFNLSVSSSDGKPGTCEYLEY
jgi:hypothetical protein